MSVVGTTSRMNVVEVLGSELFGRRPQTGTLLSPARADRRPSRCLFVSGNKVAMRYDEPAHSRRILGF